MPSRALDRIGTAVAQTIPELQSAQFRGVQKAALEAKNIINAEIRKVAGADMKLSGVGRSGSRVGARYDIKGKTNPTALVRAFGQLQLIERDTGPHLIVPKGRIRKKRGRGFRKGAKALTIGSNLRPAALHPGTKGQRPFARGAEKAAKVTPKIFQEQIDYGLRRAWK